MKNDGQERILTIPNALSIGRLLCIPVFLWLLLAREERYVAGLLLAAMGTTDFVDGYLARHLHQESNLGRILDPTADRLLLGAGVIAILIDGSVPTWVALLALIRELTVGLGVVSLVVLGARDVVDVKLVGKAGTFTLMVAFPLFLASNPDGGAPWHELARPLAWAFVIPGLVLSWIAAAGYVPAARQALARRGAAPTNR